MFSYSIFLFNRDQTVVDKNTNTEELQYVYNPTHFKVTLNCCGKSNHAKIQQTKLTRVLLSRVAQNTGQKSIHAVKPQNPTQSFLQPQRFLSLSHRKWHLHYLKTKSTDMRESTSIWGAVDRSCGGKASTDQRTNVQWSETLNSSITISALAKQLRRNRKWQMCFT